MHHPPRTPTKLTRANTCTAPSYNMGKKHGETRWDKQVYLMVAAHTHFCMQIAMLFLEPVNLWLQHINMTEYFTYSNIYFKYAEKELYVCISNASVWKKDRETEKRMEQRVSNVTEINWNCHCSNLRLDLESRDDGLVTLPRQQKAEMEII